MIVDMDKPKELECILCKSVYSEHDIEIKIKKTFGICFACSENLDFEEKNK